MLAAWDAAGAPEGDPAAPPPPADLKPTELSGKDLEIAPKPFVTSGDRDEFRCFVLDPKLTARTCVNGTHFIAGNPSVLHHIILFADSARESEGKADADGGYDCFGGVGLPGPGDGPSGPEFRIPAGAAGHTETMQATIPGDPSTPEIFLHGVLAHIHLVGVDQKVEIQRGSAEPAEECLLQVPAWDFSWQRSYAYDAPVEDLPRLSPGDKLKIRCTYDNTLENPALVGALTEQNLSAPVDVAMGEETLEEMCIAGLQLLTRAP